MNTETEKSPLEQVKSLLSATSKEKRNIEILTLLGDLVDKTKQVKVTYRGNEKHPELMDFFVDGEYIESSTVQPKIFLDFRAAKIEQGFVAGSSFIIKKVFENIKNSGNEGK